MLLEHPSNGPNLPYEYGLATLYLATLDKWVNSINSVEFVMGFSINAGSPEAATLVTAAMAMRLEDIVLALLERKLMPTVWMKMLKHSSVLRREVGATSLSRS